MDMLQVLMQLCSASGPSGFELPVSRLAAELLRPLVDEVRIDRLGNVIGVKRCGNPAAKRLVLDAHLDEIGLVVTGIEDGFLRFQAIGGVDPRILPAREVRVLADEPLPGVVISLPPHVLKPENQKKALPMSELLIDVGLSQAQAEARIPLGTPIVYREGCFALGEKQVCGKAMDDRACFVGLLRAMELLQDKHLDVDVHVLGSISEEVSDYLGARTGVYAIDPDWCVAVDVTHGDTPDMPKDRTMQMGGGPAIGIGPNVTRWMSDRMKEKARTQDIPFQYEIMGGNSYTNAWVMQVSREGIPTAVLSLPLKYMHTPVEVMDVGDLEQLAQLLAAFVVDLGKEAKYPC